MWLSWRPQAATSRLNLAPYCLAPARSSPGQFTGVELPVPRRLISSMLRVRSNRPAIATYRLWEPVEEKPGPPSTARIVPAACRVRVAGSQRKPIPMSGLAGEE